MSKELIGKGNPFEIEWVDRAYSGARRSVMFVDDNDSSLTIGNLTVDAVGEVSIASSIGFKVSDWTYITSGARETNADHISGGQAGTDPADLNVVADNSLYLNAYVDAKLQSTANNVELYAAKGVTLGSNGGAGCKLTLNGTTGRPKWALGTQYTTPSGTDSQKITAIIAILNDMGFFDAP